MDDETLKNLLGNKALIKREDYDDLTDEEYEEVWVPVHCGTLKALLDAYAAERCAFPCGACDHCERREKESQAARAAFAQELIDEGVA